MPRPAGHPVGLPRVITGVTGLAGIGLIIAAIVIVWKFVTPGGAISPARIVWLLVILAAIAVLAWLVFRYHRLPLWLLGVSGATSIPAVPLHLSELPATILKLGLRRSQMGQAANALTTVWTIGKYTGTAYTFMGMGTPDSTYTSLALEKPEQYAMAWTTLGGIYETASRDWLPQFAATLTDPAGRRGSSGRPSRATGCRSISSSSSASARTTMATSKSSAPRGRRGWKRSRRRRTFTSST
jgi:hypothetical protein